MSEAVPSIIVQSWQQGSQIADKKIHNMLTYFKQKQKVNALPSFAYFFNLINLITHKVALGEMSSCALI